jgi:hypothetical protein
MLVQAKSRDRALIAAIALLPILSWSQQQQMSGMDRSRALTAQGTASELPRHSAMHPLCRIICGLPNSVWLPSPARSPIEPTPMEQLPA